MSTSQSKEAIPQLSLSVFLGDSSWVKLTKKQQIPFNGKWRVNPYKFD